MTDGCDAHLPLSPCSASKRLLLRLAASLLPKKTSNFFLHVCSVPVCGSHTIFRAFTRLLNGWRKERDSEGNNALYSIDFSYWCRLIFPLPTMITKRTLFM